GYQLAHNETRCGVEGDARSRGGKRGEGCQGVECRIGISWKTRRMRAAVGALALRAVMPGQCVHASNRGLGVPRRSNTRRIVAPDEPDFLETKRHETLNN